MQRPEIYSLTGLRGCAALFVMFYHYHSYELTSGAGYNFLRHGYLCVDLFFVLSGFVMAMTYGDVALYNKLDYLRFLSRRLARVYPLYFVVTACQFIKLSLRHNIAYPRPPLSKLASNLLLIQSWGLTESIVPPSWSISAEWAAYLLFPFLVVACLRRYRSGFVASCLVAVTVLTLLCTLPADMLHIVRTRGPLDTASGFAPIVRCVSEFTLGILAWRTSVNKTVARLVTRSWLSSGVIAAIVFLLFIPDSDLFIVLLCPVLVLSLSNDAPTMSKIVGCTPLIWLGNISYSVYLLHVLFPNLGFAEKLAARHIRHPYALALTITAACVLMAATATYFLIERPGSRFVKNFFKEQRSSVAGEWVLKTIA